MTEAGIFNVGFSELLANEYSNLLHVIVFFVIVLVTESAPPSHTDTTMLIFCVSDTWLSWVSEEVALNARSLRGPQTTKLELA